MGGITPKCLRRVYIYKADMKYMIKNIWYEKKKKIIYQRLYS